MFRKRVAQLAAAALVLSMTGAAAWENQDLGICAAEENGIWGTDPETEADPEGKTDPETKRDPEAETVPELGRDPETEAGPENETDPETESDPEGETDQETGPGLEEELETEADPEGETEPETEIDPEGETEPETEIDPEGETDPETEADPENETDQETGSCLEEELETETDTEDGTDPDQETGTGHEEDMGKGQKAGNPNKKKKKKKPEKKEGNAGEGAGAADSGSYYWDSSWYIKKDFRFRQVEAAPALTSKGEAVVYDAMSEDGREVGVLPYFGIAYVLDDAACIEGWAYVESGDVRGFVQEEYLSCGEFAEITVGEIGEEAFETGTMLCEKSENAAYTYTHTTVQEVLAPKEYAVVLTAGDILEYASPSARAVGTASSGTVVCVLADAGGGWRFVESGDVRGFIQQKDLLCGETAEALTLDTEEERAMAEACMAPEENRSLYYTLLSTKEASSGIGEQLAAYAAGFAGKLPYVWGGTSLENGADCSGFTQAVYAAFGVQIPRLAEEQGVSGEAVESLAQAKPGDIIYWSGSPHVGIYLGNGKAAQCSGGSRNTASNPGKGVTVSDAGYRPIRSIRRFLIEAEDYCGVGDSRRDATRYTQDELELIWAIVAQEDNGSYEGALAVISSAMNRTESGRWGSLGGNALMQLTAPGQYCYSMDRYWVSRLGGNVPEYVKKAVDDCLNKGIRNHGYTSFRSRKGSQTGPDAVQIGGNWFFGA